VARLMTFSEVLIRILTEPLDGPEKESLLNQIFLWFKIQVQAVPKAHNLVHEIGAASKADIQGVIRSLRDSGRVNLRKYIDVQAMDDVHQLGLAAYQESSFGHLAGQEFAEAALHKLFMAALFGEMIEDEDLRNCWPDRLDIQPQTWLYALTDALTEVVRSVQTVIVLSDWSLSDREQIWKSVWEGLSTAMDLTIDIVGVPPTAIDAFNTYGFSNSFRVRMGRVARAADHILDKIDDLQVLLHHMAAIPE